MKKKYYYIILLIIVFIFMSYNVIYTYDSLHYLDYVDILFNRLPFSSWDIVRGPSFPLTLYLFSIIFGENQNAHLLLQLFNFLLLIFLIIEVLNISIKEYKYKKCIVFILSFLICFNPLIFGYYHVLLTEYISIFLTVLSIYFSYKWIYVKENKKKIIYLLFFTFLLSYLWMLKQPYSLCLLVPVLAASILSLLKDKSVINFIYRLGTIVISLSVMFISIVIWNRVLVWKNADMNTGRDSSSALSSAMLNLQSYVVVDSDSNDIDLYDLSEEEINDINSNKYAILLTIKNSKIIDKDILKKYKGKISAFNTILISIENMFQHPKIILGDYVKSYCALSSLCVIESQNGSRYYITNELEYNDLFENRIIGYRIYDNTLENVFWVPNDDFAYNRVKYSSYKNAGFTRNVFLKMTKPTSIMYKVLIIFCPLLFLISLFLYILVYKKYKDLLSKVELLIINICFAFLYLIANVYVGAFIDRYSIETFIPLIISLILIITIIIDIKEIKCKKSKSNKSEKVNKKFLKK